jgi:replicative DNA helicase Mcm
MSAQNTQLVDKFEQFFRNYYHEEIGELAEHYPNEQRSLFVDWFDLFKYDNDLADDYIDQPRQLKEYAEEALRMYDLPIDVELSRAHVRVENLPDTNTVEPGAIRSNHSGKAIAIDGSVSKVSKVKPWPEEAAFECNRCGTLTYIPQTFGSFQDPHECQGCERQGPFDINDEQSEWTDTQVVKVEQPPEKTQGGRGSAVEINLEDDLVTSPDGGYFQPGDRVTITGNTRMEKHDSNGNTSFEHHVDADSITIEDSDYEELEITNEDIEAIREIANGERGDPYELGVGSIAPKIYGYEEEKQALFLQMFRGVQVRYPDGSVDRGDFHILLLGDPGTGKSKLLKGIDRMAPRSVFASAKGASASGMTAAVVPDDFGDSKWSVEAGALVLANKGVACVDEIDKVEEDAISSMHEALESQEVHVNKAGINTRLPAETSLLAAGNPKYGRFDPYEPIGEQIDLGPTLLSRFDLMFMVSDQPDPDEDEDVANHMVDSRGKGIEYTRSPDESDAADDEEITPDIEPELLRKYVAYARQNVFPSIEDDEVARKIVSFFIGLRSQSYDDDSPVSVTFRKLEALLRIAEASARVRLSDTVELQDAERATDLVMSSLRDVGIDPETGQFDADVVETGTSKTQAERKKVIESVIDELEDEHDAGAPFDKIIERAEEAGIGSEKAEEEFLVMKSKGDIFESSQADDHFRLSKNALG